MEKNKDIETIDIDDDLLVPDYDMGYRLNPDDSKQIEKIVKYFCSIIRGSFEYRLMIETFKTQLDIKNCVFYSKYSIDNGFSIEFHHHPFKLRHYVETVVRQQLIENDGVIHEDKVCKEVTMIHYRFLVGLVPLSPTAHQLADLGKLPIHPDLIIGNWQQFYYKYNEYMSDTVKEVYTNYIEDSAHMKPDEYPEILRQKHVHINASNKEMISQDSINKLLVSEKLKNINNEQINLLLKGDK